MIVQDRRRDWNATQVALCHFGLSGVTYLNVWGHLMRFVETEVDGLLGRLDKYYQQVFNSARANIAS